MGGKMIKTIIIISLCFVIYTLMTVDEFLDHIALGLDKLQDLVYTIKSEVK